MFVHQAVIDARSKSDSRVPSPIGVCRELGPAGNCNQLPTTLYQGATKECPSGRIVSTGQGA